MLVKRNLSGSNGENPLSLEGKGELLATPAKGAWVGKLAHPHKRNSPMHCRGWHDRQSLRGVLADWHI